MLDALPVSGWELTGWGIVALFVIGLLSGRLTSRREVDAEKERADTWQAAWEASQTAGRVKDEAIAELLQHSRTTVRVLESIQLAGEADRASREGRAS